MKRNKENYNSSNRLRTIFKPFSLTSLMIKIDGSYGEGGGQILRTAISLSCLTCEAVEIYKIRASRPKPGLAMQHLKGIEAAKLISNAEVEGLKLGSTRVIFKPRSLKGGEFNIEISTAGSVTLILQSILLPSMAAEKNSSFRIRGGTDVQWSPPVDYIKNVTFKALRDLKAVTSIDLLARGYYPKGGGLVNLHVQSSKLEGVSFKSIDDGVRGVSHCSNLPSHIAERQARSAKAVLEKEGYKAEIEIDVRKGISTGSGIVVWCGYKGGSALGERGKRAEMVGEEAAKNLLEELKSNASFDGYLADQIMPFAAVAKGVTRYTTSTITLHQRSNAYVIEQFLGNVVEINEEKREIKIAGSNLL